MSSKYANFKRSTDFTAMLPFLFLKKFHVPSHSVLHGNLEQVKTVVIRIWLLLNYSETLYVPFTSFIKPSKFTSVIKQPRLKETM